MNELSVMRSLNHHNVIRLESVFESDNSIYVVLEFLQGDQLFHKIQKNKGHFTKAEIKIGEVGSMTNLLDNSSS
jgi:serine/threonine protein kinase